ncbi:unnamed protein product [Moneuplotes crassus]|uniref:Uncharacterized protein n=1 Tax=Euplotes crassus TaxID=5936 RepID=A0AAD1TZ80_EUPCR|nr:unnamed protein product [Moneuplotes crassus]
MSRKASSKKVDKALKKQIQSVRRSSGSLFEGMVEANFSNDPQVSWMMIYRVLGQIKPTPKAYNGPEVRQEEQTKETKKSKKLSKKKSRRKLVKGKSKSFNDGLFLYKRKGRSTSLNNSLRRRNLKASQEQLSEREEEVFTNYMYDDIFQESDKPQLLRRFRRRSCTCRFCGNYKLRRGDFVIFKDEDKSSEILDEDGFARSPDSDVQGHNHGQNHGKGENMVANSFRNFKNVMTAISYMKRGHASCKSMGKEENLEIYSENEAARKPTPKAPSVVRDYKKSDYIVGKMNINSSILSPIKSEKLTERFFSKRVKRINRKKAKKWLKKFDYAESTKTIRKALSRLSQKRSSLPYCMSQRPTPRRDKMLTMRKTVNTPILNLRAGSSNSKRFKSSGLTISHGRSTFSGSKKKFFHKRGIQDHAFQTLYSPKVIPVSRSRQ